MLDHARLKAALHYDPETGVWTRLTNGPRYKKWDRADRLLTRKQAFRSVMVYGQAYLSHRLAWFYVTGEWPTKLVDHIDLDATNNAWLNLREATKEQNAWNSPAHRDNQTGFKGVYFDKRRGNYAAAIFAQGKKYHLGTRSTPQEAHLLYIAAAKRLHGEFARAS